METPQSSHTSPRITILMAVYNASAYLHQAIDSVLEQSYPDWQLICVDDASTDSSLQILQQYALQDSRIQVLRQATNQGQAVARNLALQQAEGEIIMMLDADDWLSADCLAQLVPCFCDGVDSVVLHVERYLQDTHQQHPLELPCGINEVISGHDAFLLSLDWRLHGIYAVRRHIHLRYPYDASCRLYSDDNTTRLHYLHSRQVAFTTGTYYYRQHSASCTNAITAARFLYMEANLSMKLALEAEQLPDSILRLYEKHRWLNYIGQHWLFYNHCHQLTPDERAAITTRFRKLYTTFTYRPVPPKFGYTWFHSYRFFLLQLRLYFTLRHLLRIN